MKVLIKTEGGKDIGFGHLTRCISIYQAFREKKINPIFIINNSSEAGNFLKDSKIEFVIDNGGKITSCDVLIIDSYLTPRYFYYETSKFVRLLVSIDDFNRLSYPSGLLINGSIYAREIEYRKSRNLKYLLGPSYIPLRKSFWSIDTKKINEGIKNVLLTFGGFNYSFALKVARFLLKNFDFNLNAIFNRNATNHPLFHNPKVRVFDNVSAEDMKKLMLNADICISGGGQTTYELARCGVPTIGICFADNQLLNLRGWQERGFIKYVGWFNDKNLYHIIKSSLLEMDYKSRLKMSQVGQRVVDGQGARRVIREILTYAKD